LDAQELIADHELVAHLELDRRANAQKYAVPALEVLQEHVVFLKAQRRFARMAEALARKVHRTVGADQRRAGGQLVALGTTRETAQHVQRVDGRLAARHRRLAERRRGVWLRRRWRNDRGRRALFLLRELLDVVDLRRLGEKLEAPDLFAGDHAI